MAVFATTSSKTIGAIRLKVYFHRLMSSGEGYVRRLRSISEALDRTNKHARELRAQKNEAKVLLHSWMIARGLEEYEGYKINKLVSKKVPRKPSKEKKEDAMRLFGEAGIADPEGFWEELQKTQKTTRELPREEVTDDTFTI